MYDRNSNILVKTGVTAEELDSAVSNIRPDHGLKPALKAIVAAEKQYGISAIFITAHAATETGWGRSMIARTKNNLFGFNAIDSNPGQANSYPTQEASVKHYAEFLSTHYLSKDGKYYNGATPSGVMTRYASAGDRAADTIANIMSMLASRIGLEGEKIPDGFGDKTEEPAPEPEPETDQPEPEQEPKADDQPAVDDAIDTQQPKKKTARKK